MTTDEVLRIQQVYQGYNDANFANTLWSTTNAGNQKMSEERNVIIGDLLRHYGYVPLTCGRVLDVGCGSGDVLASMTQWGALPERLFGLELLPQRASAAHHVHPELQIMQCNAAELGFADDEFDLILFLTVFSSVLDSRMRGRIADEAMRVLKPGGAIIWYDLRVPNPRNKNTKPLKREDVCALFPSLIPDLRTSTLLPPLARRLGKATNSVYPVLAKFPALHTHYVGLLKDSRK